MKPDIANHPADVAPAAAPPCLDFADILSPARDGAIPVAWRFSSGDPPAGFRLFTLADLRADAARVAAALAARPEIRWALCFASTYHFAAAFLAALHARKTVVVPGHTLENLLEEQRDTFDALLTDLPFRHPDFPRIDFPVTSAPAPAPSHATAAPALPSLPPVRGSCAAPEKGGVIFHTSGSTGHPKAVHKTLSALQRENDIHAARRGAVLRGAHIAGTTSHQHLYGFQFRMLLPLTLGVPFNADIIEYHEQLLAATPRPFALVTSPAFLKRLDPALARAADELPGCRHVLSAGGFLAPADAGLCHRALGCHPFEIYGSTEAGAIAWRDTAPAGEDRFWKPLPGVRICCDPADGRLSLRSPFLPENETLVTDDRIRLAPAGDGSFELLGRMDRIIKIEEKRVSLPEVEQRLLMLETVADAAAVPLSAPNRAIVGAIVVLSDAGRRQYERDGHGRFLLDLRRQLRNWLEPVALPRQLLVTDAIPVNSLGKRITARLQALFGSRPLSASPAADSPSPVVVSATDRETVVEIRLRPDLLWFRGHFARRRILPGVAQLHWILEHAARAFGTGDRILNIDTIKFRRPLVPGDLVRLRLLWSAGDHRLEFTVAAIAPGGPVTAASGRLVLLPPPRPLRPSGTP
ncbi:acyl-CoA synthetase [Opitutaceae bacterium TAV5]|nr:acyl-CoA synthetase [Opitutaceae bacterium TAV5]